MMGYDAMHRDLITLTLRMMRLVAEHEGMPATPAHKAAALSSMRHVVDARDLDLAGHWDPVWQEHVDNPDDIFRRKIRYSIVLKPVSWAARDYVKRREAEGHSTLVDLPVKPDGTLDREALAAHGGVL